VLDRTEYEALREGDSGECQDGISRSGMNARIEERIGFAEGRLDGLPVCVPPGNDDPFAVDEVWDFPMGAISSGAEGVGFIGG
jgi:hypothetical protein